MRGILMLCVLPLVAFAVALMGTQAVTAPPTDAAVAAALGILQAQRGPTATESPAMIDVPDLATVSLVSAPTRCPGGICPAFVLPAPAVTPAVEASCSSCEAAWHRPQPVRRLVRWVWLRGRCCR